MTDFWVQYVKASGEPGRLVAVTGMFTVENFDAGQGGLTEVQLVATINADQVIEVLISGKEYREGAQQDWTRDVGNKKILFNFTVPEGIWIKVKIYK